MVLSLDMLWTKEIIFKTENYLARNSSGTRSPLRNLWREGFLGSWLDSRSWVLGIGIKSVDWSFYLARWQSDQLLSKPDRSQATLSTLPKLSIQCNRPEINEPSIQDKRENTISPSLTTGWTKLKESRAWLEIKRGDELVQVINVSDNRFFLKSCWTVWVLFNFFKVQMV